MNTDDIVLVPMRRVPVGKRGACLGEASATCIYSDQTVAHALELRAKGWTNYRVAAEIGCSPRLVSFWAAGSRHKEVLAHKLVPITSN